MQSEYRYSDCILFINQKVKERKLNINDRPVLLLLLAECYFENVEYDFSKKLILGKIDLNNLDNSTALRSKILLSKLYLRESKIDSAAYWHLEAKKNIDYTIQDYLIGEFYLNQGLVSLRKSKEDVLINYSKASFFFDSLDHVFLKYSYLKADRFLDKDVFDSAKFYIDKGLRIQKKYFPKDTISLIELQLLKSFYWFYSGNVQKSIDYLEFTIRPIVFREKRTFTKRDYFLKADFFRFSIIPYAYLGKIDKTIEYSFNYLKIAPNFLPRDHFRFGEVYREIANSYLSVKRIPEYLNYIDKSIEILKNSDLYLKEIDFFKSKRYYISRDFDSCVYYGKLYLGKTDYLNILKRNELETIENIALSYLYKGENNNSRSFLTKLFHSNSFSKISISSKVSLYNLILKTFEHSNEKEIKPEISSYLKSIEFLIDSLVLDNKQITSSLIRLMNTKNNLLLNSSLIESSGLKSQIDQALSLNLKSKQQEFKRLADVRFADLFLESQIIRSFYLKKKFIQTKEVNYLLKSLDSYLLCSEIEYQYYNDVESINDNLSLSNYRIDLIGEIIELINADSSFLLPPKNLIEIFEKNRARFIVSNLISKQKKQLELVPKPLREKYSLLKKNNLSLKERLLNLSKYKNSKLFKDVEANHIVSNHELELLQIEIKKHLDINSSKNYFEDLINLEMIQLSLIKGQVLVFYYSGDSNNSALAISKDHIELINISSVKDEIISQFRNSLNPASINSNGVENYHNYVQSAYAIYQTQLKPVLDQFPEAKKIYVIPDGQLHHIPFEALISELPENTMANYGQLQYLIKDYTFSYANSATTLFKTKSILNRLETSDNKVLAFAPSYDFEDQDTNAQLAQRNQGKQPLSNLRGNLNNLRYNGEEVNAISSYFDGKTFTKDLANEQQFKENADQYDVLHLSMHAIVDPEDPMYSYLAFAPDPSDTSTGDGFLHAFEIYDMNLNAEMAVLSACNTGYGKLYKGEGPMSLAKAFTYAGCPSVVMSYWPADDQASSDIMNLFYANLAEGLKKDEALRKAKLAYFEKASPYKKSPAYWNNFVVMGDVSPLVKDNTQLYFYLGITIICFLLAFAFGVRYFVKKKQSLAN